MPDMSNETLLGDLEIALPLFLSRPDATLPAALRPPVRAQLARLDASVARAFGGTEDEDLAMQPDTQGIGGPRREA